MRRSKTRSFVYDALFVIAVMVAAMASAVLEARAVLAALPAIDAPQVAKSAPPRADQPSTAGASVDGARVSVARNSAH